MFRYLCILAYIVCLSCSLPVPDHPGPFNGMNRLHRQSREATTDIPSTSRDVYDQTSDNGSSSAVGTDQRAAHQRNASFPLVPAHAAGVKNSLWLSSCPQCYKLPPPYVQNGSCEHRSHKHYQESGTTDAGDGSAGGGALQMWKRYRLHCWCHDGFSMRKYSRQGERRETNGLRTTLRCEHFNATHITWATTLTCQRIQCAGPETEFPNSAVKRSNCTVLTSGDVHCFAGSTVELGCKERFGMVAEADRWVYCNSDGEWSPSNGPKAPACQELWRMACLDLEKYPHLLERNNLEHNSSSLVLYPGDRVTFTCKPGYKFEAGEVNTLKCFIREEDGLPLFDGDFPTCEAVSCSAAKYLAFGLTEYRRGRRVRVRSLSMEMQQNTTVSIGCRYCIRNSANSEDGDPSRQIQLPGSFHLCSHTVQKFTCQAHFNNVTELWEGVFKPAAGPEVFGNGLDNTPLKSLDNLAAVCFPGNSTREDDREI